MRKTNYSLTNKNVLGKIPYLNQSGLNNLSNSGRLKRKKVLGVWMYCSYSVNSFLQQMNSEEYLTYSETKQMLETNGIKDTFKRFSDKNETLKCKYVRVTNEFPMSVKNLIKHNYLDVDKDVLPQRIKKDSVIKTIQHFSKVKNNGVSTSKPSNNSGYSSMKKVG